MPTLRDMPLTCGGKTLGRVTHVSRQVSASPSRHASSHTKQVDKPPPVRYCLHMKDRPETPTGDALLAILAALSNPHRLRILAALHAGGRNYVSQLARDLGISRPLLHLHLQKLQDAGLVTSQMELSTDGKALNYFEVSDFNIALTPALITAAVQSLSNPTDD
jgi:DNA-binding transcriptional ArsR family regulator